MTRLSFIVPFYNVEPYIEECIRSLYNQDIPKEEYEVICVDDCSPDGSRAIVERLQQEYPTLRLLTHTENKRQGGARNTGLLAAQGRYIWFVDSDDYIKSSCLKGLLEIAENERLDVLKFHSEYSNLKASKRLIGSTVVTTGSEIIFGIEISTPLLDRCNSAVMELIRKDYLIQNNIFFVEYCQYEDDDYAYKLYAFANRAFIVSESPYVIRINQESTTRRTNDLRRVRDIYAQAIRMAYMDDALSKQDPRWHTMISECINDCINNCVFRMMKKLSLRNQLHFWIYDRKQWWKLRSYLSRKAYAKLCCYTLWRLLQK